MKRTASMYWPLLVAAIVYAVLLGWYLRPYHWSVTALFHLDDSIATQHSLPPRFVVLSMPGYDGMEYYQIARNVPKIVNPARWSELNGVSPSSYAYQRILLPIAAYLLALGQEGLFPLTFLLINIGALLGTCALLLCPTLRFLSLFLWGRNVSAPQKQRQKQEGDFWLRIYALALALSPAATIGLHFSLAEPLTLFLLTWFLLRYERNQQLQPLDVLLLSSVVLSREINGVFVVLTLGFFLLKRQRRNAALTLIPLAAFFILHAWIYAVFGEIPFLMSTEKSGNPGGAIVQLLMGKAGGYNQYTLSSIALFLLFILPATILTGFRVLRERSLDYLSLMLLVFLAVMIIMPDHIWGSITSIGRAITPIYPLFVVSAAKRDRPTDRMIAIAVLALGFVAGLGLAEIHHPFTVT